MISHFSIRGSDSSLYFAISTIRQGAETGILFSGVLGDGSAEAWFEASIAEQLRVRVLPIWDAGSDALCQRYDQELIEQGLHEVLEEVRFRSELVYDPDGDRWQQRLSAEISPPAPGYAVGGKGRPHQSLCGRSAALPGRVVC